MGHPRGTGSLVGRVSGPAASVGTVPATPTVMWFRRDLRASDHPALHAAAAEADGAGVLLLFVLDDALLGPAGPSRTAWLFRSLRALGASFDGALVVRRGDPAQVVPAAAAEVGAASVHVSADTNPYGRRRDDAVAAADRFIVERRFFGFSILYLTLHFGLFLAEAALRAHGLTPAGWPARF